MNILVTGASGFIGKNLCLELRNRNFRVQEFDTDNSISDLTNFLSDADFIVHLAGANRPLTIEEFYDTNANFTIALINSLKKSGKKIPLIFSSSIQVQFENDYGKSKKLAEQYLIDFSKETGNPVYIFRLANVFGKWSRPNYNSVIATFCYDISRNIEIIVNDPEKEISFVYIDDVVNKFVQVIEKKIVIESSAIQEVRPIYNIKLGKLADLIYSFKKSRCNLMVPNLANSFENKLYITYLSYLDIADFSYTLQTHKDTRGSFTEFLKTTDAGQISVNITKPAATKGNHWHHSKTEKFLVVSGEASIKFRQVNEEEVIEYIVNGGEFHVVDIPPGYTHNITNIGQGDLITIMWASEEFNPDHPDTFQMEVIKK